MKQYTNQQIRKNIRDLYGADSIQKSNQEELEKSANDYFEKGGKKAAIGEIRTFGGRQYIRTAEGWKFHGKGTGTKAQEHVKNNSDKKKPMEWNSKEDLNKFIDAVQKQKDDKVAAEKDADEEYVPNSDEYKTGDDIVYDQGGAKYSGTITGGDKKNGYEVKVDKGLSWQKFHTVQHSQITKKK